MVPTTDTKLMPYSTNWNTRAIAAAADFGLTAPQVAQYTSLYTPWLDAFNAAKADGARSKALTQAKTDSKWNLIRYNRELYQMVQANPLVTNENKTLIGVVVKDFIPSPTPTPDSKPVSTVLGIVGRIVSYRVAWVGSPNSRSKAPGAAGVLVLSYVGENPPTDAKKGWTIEGQWQRTDFEVQYPDTVAPGEKCWMRATWVGERGEYGPAGDPISAYLQIGPVSEAA